MDISEKRKQLTTLPWQALYEYALTKNPEEQNIRSKDKNSIIEHILLTCDITDNEIEQLVNAYIYGDRVTFTLWNFKRALSHPEYEALSRLEGSAEPYVDADGFRGLHIISVKKYDDRFEMLYVYGKEYTYINEDGRNSSVWEQHRGCIWIGLNRSYLAVISKHEKMTSCMISYVIEKLGIPLTQIKPPKAAIERCVNAIAISRITLQGLDGEKTIVSRAEGLTEDQQKEVARIKCGRFDTSGSYIARLEEETEATIKYNVKKGSIGIYKHLSAKALFAWSKQAIDIIFEEINKLKGLPAEDIFKQLGVQIKWPGLYDSEKECANWFLSEVIQFLRYKEERIVSIPENVASLLSKETIFSTVPRVYCDICESYEIPYCSACGKRLIVNRLGNLTCSCRAHQPITCPEGHKCRIENWYFPTKQFCKSLNQNITAIFNDEPLEYVLCVMGQDLHIVQLVEEDTSGVEIHFDQLFEFSHLPENVDEEVRLFALRLNEKCEGTCTKEKVNKCVKDCNMACLPKAFYTVLPDFRPQPHKGMEYGDVSAEVHTALSHYELKAIIKKNSMNKGRHTDADLLNEYLLSTSTEGQEIIRQFVEQGMADTRCQLVAVVAPQYFDAGLKGTLRYLARLCGKKILFIELDDIARIVQANEVIATK